MGANRTAAGVSPQLAKPVKLMVVLFLVMTTELAWGEDCPRCVVCPVCPADNATPKCEQYTQFSVQLRSLKSAQFAGFYAAQELGYWSEVCLNVAIYQPHSEFNVPENFSEHGADAAIPHYL
jgi:ABC-type nitrate/sulfonate/bicarbonate transport system substrate-binding protein